MSKREREESGADKGVTNEEDKKDGCAEGPPLSREDEAKKDMARFVAPIKREHKVPINTPKPVDGALATSKEPEKGADKEPGKGGEERANGAADAGEGGEEKGGKGDQPKSKRQKMGKGQNKRGDHKGVNLNVQVMTKLPHLCKRIGVGDECSFGSSCKFSHDIEGYLKAIAELPQIGDLECPSVSKGRICRFGICCRFLPCREVWAAALREKQKPEGFEGGREGGQQQDEVNLLGREVQAQLREVKGRGKYDWKAWRPALQAYRKARGKEGGRERKKQNDKGNAEKANDDPMETAGEKEEGERKEEQGVTSTTEAEQKQDEVEKKEGGCEGSDVAAYELGARLRKEEKKRLDFRGKTYLAPLTTVGNLPFRRLCKTLDCDVTVGEMALASKIVDGNAGEWALFRRHKSEDLFGIQIASGWADQVAMCGELFERECSADFFDLNCGCPLDGICSKGMGADLLDRPQRLQEIVSVATASTNVPMTVKLRVGHWDDKSKRNAHLLIPQVSEWGASAVTLHGRSRQQRYSRLADWDYIRHCASIAQTSGIPLVGNGDVLSYEDYNAHMEGGNLSTCMVARGALIKPWVFREIKEQRHWDISASERLDLMKDFCRFGLDHWGSDSLGVEKTRSFFLEWQAWLCRYIPVGVLEVMPPVMNHRNPGFVARNDLEQLMAGTQVQDWIKLSEMMLGPVPTGFNFVPKHRSSGKNAADTADAEG